MYETEGKTSTACLIICPSGCCYYLLKLNSIGKRSVCSSSSSNNRFFCLLVCMSLFCSVRIVSIASVNIPSTKCIFHLWLKSTQHANCAVCWNCCSVHLEHFAYDSASMPFSVDDLGSSFFLYCWSELWKQRTFQRNWQKIIIAKRQANTYQPIAVCM